MQELKDMLKKDCSLPKYNISCKEDGKMALSA